GPRQSGVPGRNLQGHPDGRAAGHSAAHLHQNRRREVVEPTAGPHPNQAGGYQLRRAQHHAASGSQSIADGRAGPKHNQRGLRRDGWQPSRRRLP
nr:hypothetical protein [Tanacetum cinerariifolium]